MRVYHALASTYDAMPRLSTYIGTVLEENVPVNPVKSEAAYFIKSHANAPALANNMSTLGISSPTVTD